jgi:hypothetical protein
VLAKDRVELGGDAEKAGEAALDPPAQALVRAALLPTARTRCLECIGPRGKPAEPLGEGGRESGDAPAGDDVGRCITARVEVVLGHSADAAKVEGEAVEKLCGALGARLGVVPRRAEDLVGVLERPPVGGANLVVGLAARAAERPADRPVVLTPLAKP